MGYFLVSAAHKSSGKTTVSIGLAAALARQGQRVQTYKKGPDYIDPMWLAAASGRPCYNLDFYLMSRAEIQALFSHHLRNADVGLIEANKGLYDGLDLDGSNSNAALAMLLGAPVILVIDARGMTRGIAPLILGYQAFEPNIRIAGVILNRLGGTRHEAKLRAVIEHYTDVPVLGAIPQDPRLEIHERHLGLVTRAERQSAERLISCLADAIGQHVDLSKVLGIAATAGPTARGGAPPNPPAPCPPSPTKGRPTIGVLRDAAFNFYYADDLECLEKIADLVFINAIDDRHLPPVDGLFIGGGFPETHMAPLEANRSLRRDIRQAIEGGLPTYAECGGLMYLARSIRWHDKTAEMVGIIPGDVVMHDRPQGRGYVALRPTTDHPWFVAPGHSIVLGHEFHYSCLRDLPGDLRYAYEVTRGYGVDGRHDGIILYNVLANYSHLRRYGSADWPTRFIDFVNRYRTSTRTA